MKVIVVTGSNKGIGRGIAETLCKILSKNEWIVYITARNIELGGKTVAEFQSLGLAPHFHQLDINCEESRKTLKEYLVSKYGGLDVLINNAGIAYKNNSPAPYGEQADVTLKTNYFGTLKMCQEFLPILKPNARLVNMSSSESLNALHKLSPDLYNSFIGPLTIIELDRLIQSFIKSAIENTLEKDGWPHMAYGVSSLAITKLTKILAHEIRDDPRHILINCCCPGYVGTDMSSYKGPLTIYQGAETPVYLATLPVGVDEPHGEHVYEKAVVEWK